MNSIVSQPIPLVNPLSKWLTLNNFRKKDEFIEGLTSHPGFPNLSAVTEIFEKFKIDVVVGRCDNVADLPVQTNMFLQLIGQGLVYVEGISNDKVSFVDGYGEQIEQEVDDFEFDWSGVFLLPKDNQVPQVQTGSIPTKGQGKTVLAVAVFVFLALYPSNPIALFSAFLAGLLGLYFVFDALYASKSPLYLSSKCSKSGSSTCGSIFNSDYAFVSKKLNITLLDMAVAYFISILCLLLLLPIFPNAWKILAISSSIIIPYSLYIQRTKFQKWCDFCLKIIFGQLLLIAVAMNGFEVAFNLIEVTVAMLIPLAFFILWHKKRSIVISQFESISEISRIKRIAFNQSAFLGILQDSKRISNLPNRLDRENQLTFLLSLSCPHCQTMISDVLGYWEGNEVQEETRLNFIIDNSLASKIISEFNSNQLLLKTNKEKVRALKNLIKESDLVVSNSEEHFQSEQDKKYLSWALENKLTEYPQVIYKNRITPKNYTVKEILSIIF